jgi:hypothetical protein
MIPGIYFGVTSILLAHACLANYVAAGMATRGDALICLRYDDLLFVSEQRNTRANTNATLELFYRRN